MTDKQIIRIAKEFREDILNGAPSTMYCFMITAPLQGYLSTIGISTRLVKGVFHRSGFERIHCEHYWLELQDGRILDPTADQFKDDDGKPMPSVYLGEIPSCYRIGE